MGNGTAGRALVVGGTGPTGPFVVQGLVDRGYAVTMLHTGRHERPEIPDVVEHVHTDPFDRDAVAGALGDRTFDLAVVMYGRLRDLVELLVGRVGRVLSVGGVPVLDGFGNPFQREPAGLPVPAAEEEEAELVDRGGRHEVANDKVAKMIETERAVFAAHPGATHLRYPLVYGPHQLLPREWLVVRRVLDGRRRLILPDGGLHLCSAVHVANAAASMLFCVDHPDVTGGRALHVSDEVTPTLRQTVDVLSAALGHTFEIVDLPFALATPAHPFVMRTSPHHRYSPATTLAALGHRDVVPFDEGLAQTAHWLVEHRPECGGDTERNLQDPFDYAAEDALMDAWMAARGPLQQAATAADPCFVDRYAPEREAQRARRRAVLAERRAAADDGG